MSKRRGLGRGLDALLGGVEKPDQLATDAHSGDDLRNISIEKIQRGRYQPRRHFEPESLKELSESIKEQGVIQPIVVRPMGRDFELIAGERRWRAAQLAGFEEIPAVVRDLDDRAAAAVALIENIQREELNALEEAQALQRLSTEFELTHQQVADAVGRSRAAVSNLLRLLELSNECKEFLDQGLLEMGHARCLLGLPSTKQLPAANKIIAQGLSVRGAEALVRAMLSEKASEKPNAARDPDVQSLENRLGETLGAKVDIKHAGKGGRIEIRYHSLDELEGILAHIR